VVAALPKTSHCCETSTPQSHALPVQPANMSCPIANTVSHCQHSVLWCTEVRTCKMSSLASAQDSSIICSCQECQKHTRCHETATTYSSILLQVESTAASSMWGKAHSSSIARGHSAWNKTQVSQCDHCNQGKKEECRHACFARDLPQVWPAFL